jgi:transcriptional regulator with XRE-family HTH domain
MLRVIDCLHRAGSGARMTPDEINAGIGRKIRQRRTELRLTLAQVGEKCGVSLQMVHKYEIGLSIIPAHMVWRLSQCLDVPIGYFFSDLPQLRALQRA